MSTLNPFPRTSEDRAGFQKSGGHATQQTAHDVTRDGADGLRLAGQDAGAADLSPAELTQPAQPGQPGNPGNPGKQQAIADPPRVDKQEIADNPQGKTPAAKKGDGTSKPQKPKESTQRFPLVSLSKQGLSKVVGGGGKASLPADQTTKKTSAAKGTPEAPKDATELRVVFPQDPAFVPRVDVIAIHDIDETLQKAWIYRKKSKRRVNDSRAVYASGGINSHDGSRQAPPGAKKKRVDDSNQLIERWLMTSGKRSEEEVPREPSISEAPPDDHGPTNPIFAPVEDHEHNSFSLFSMLASVHQDDDVSQQRPRLRKRPTLPNDRRKGAGRFASIAEEEKVSSVGGGRRHNADVLSDRQSSLDRGNEGRVNWLSDVDMLPSEIPGSRVMCYTYKSPEKVPSPWQYLTERAQDLVKRIVEKRTSDRVDYGTVPIVLVGLGFGALIVQRVVSLLSPPSRLARDPNTSLDMIAGLVLLDAPSTSADRWSLPRSRSQEAKKAWTQDWLLKGRNTDTSATSSTKIDTVSLWDQFSAMANSEHIPITWHYSSMVPTAEKPAQLPIHPYVLFVKKSSATAHRLSRFEGSYDDDYRSIVNLIKRSLLVKCSITKSDKLAGCLADFLRDNSPVDLQDQRGQTPLHLAIRFGKLDAVRRLVHQGKASVMKKDIEGQSALHVAVQEAAWRNPGSHGRSLPELQKVFTQIINLLMKNGARVDDVGNDGKTPWVHAKGEQNQWIRRLKDKHLIIGSSSTKSGAMERVVPPVRGPQLEACNAFDIILAEVFLQKRRERLEEVFNFEGASAFDVIYKTPTGGVSQVSQVLAATRPPHLTEDRVRCRWIHVPSNNEQWVHDLMLSLGIQDGSMGGQRHEGSRLIDRYMMPQARRYKHFHGKVTKTQPEPRPRANRLGSTDSAATVVLGSQDLPLTPEETGGKPGSKAGKTLLAPESTRTESDAIVIFMPVLGFERHRHRKFLAQSFYNVESAMQKARDRQENAFSSNFWANPQSMGSKKRTENQEGESSDNESSNSEQEMIRSGPKLYKTITKAHAQIKDKPEAQLLNGYLDSKQVKPVHCRRTLDQFSYYMLNSTEARDKSQVAYRWAKNLTAHPVKPKDRPIVMVDQLWLWAFHDGTVLTSSPSTWLGHEDFNLSNVVMHELRVNKHRAIIKSTEDLLHLILKTSVDFFRRKGPASFQFQECFQSSINSVSEDQGHLFDDFRQTTKKLHVGTLDPAERKKEIEFLFSLDKETELMVEIMDIQDELTIVKTILSQQLDVLEKFLRLYPKKAEEDADEETESRVSNGLGKSELMVLQSLVQLLKDQAAPPTEGRAPLLGKPGSRDAFQRRDVSPGGEYITPSDEKPQDGQLPKRPRPKGKEKESEQSKPVAPVKTNILQNRDLMYETIGIVENNLRIVTDMLAYAEKVERSLENLLDLKQKHANGWEARFAREGSEESQRQGNIILVFTLVTVVFLPLSFITSFFALEIDIFPKNPETSETSWPIGEVSGYLFGFSALIFIPLIVLALYVNKLITNIKEIYKQLLKALKEPEALLNTLEAERGVDHDSDDEGTLLERTQRPARSNRSGPAGTNKHHGGGANPGNHPGISSEGESKTGRYALLFGRYHFHSAIPLARDLWRYRQYRRQNARRKDNRWKDTYVTDYPLRYYQTKVNIWVVRVLVAVLAFLGSPKHRVARENDRNRRRRRRAEGEMSSSSSSSSDSEDGGNGRKGNAGGVDRRDFGMGAMMRKTVKRKKSVGSGSWKPGSVGIGSRAEEMGSMGGWSNQTRSRASLPPGGGDNDDDLGGFGGEMEVAAEKEGRRGKLSWLRMRRKGRRKEVVDEEKEVGTEEGVLEEREGGEGR